MDVKTGKALQERELREIAHEVVELVGVSADLAVDFDDRSVAYLDRFIEQHRAGLAKVDRDALALGYGCFLGECILQNYGGQWDRVDGQWSIRLNGGAVVRPFVKVAKQLSSGASGRDSIHRFYRAIPSLMGLRFEPARSEIVSG